MNKQEVIKILEKKRETALDNSEYYRDKENEKYEKMNRARVDSYTLAIQLVEQIDEPQAEKVEVSQEFVDWVEKAKTVKDGLDYKNWCVKEIATIGWGNWLHEPERILDGKVIYDEWVNAVADNKEKHIKAIYDGYTVKPKRWVVKFGLPNDTRYFRKFNGCHDYNYVGKKEKAHVFTDRAKAEAVATLVEGSVEEV